jgi:hypothetical protein
VQFASMREAAPNTSRREIWLPSGLARSSMRRPHAKRSQSRPRSPTMKLAPLLHAGGARVEISRDSRFCREVRLFCITRQRF